MCPISQGQANNDWKAIEVKQTDSIQLVIAVFASVSTCEEVSRKTFLSIFLPSFPSLIQVVAFGHHDIYNVLAYFYVRKNANNFLSFLYMFDKHRRMFLFIKLTWCPKKLLLSGYTFLLVWFQFAWFSSASPSAMFVFRFETKQVNKRSFCTPE